jgi:cytochrome c biogenesis factor
MKRALAIILETILFLLLFLAGSFLPVFYPALSWTVPLAGNRYFVLDGVLLMLVAYGLFLLTGAARRRFSSAAVTSSTALVFAVILGLAMKFGFRSH